MVKSSSSLASPATSDSTSSSSASSSSSSRLSSANSSRANSRTGNSLLNQLRCAAPSDRRKRLAANARERKRMHLLNKAYDQLRLRLADAQNKSKYDVLVQAKEYIQALAAICETHDRQQAGLHPNNHSQDSQQVLNKTVSATMRQTSDSKLLMNKPQTSPVDMSAHSLYNRTSNNNNNQTPANKPNARTKTIHLHQHLISRNHYCGYPISQQSSMRLT